MQIINNVHISYIVRTAICQWKWRTEIELTISNGLKVMNVFINKIDEQSVSGETVWLNVQTNLHGHRSPQTLIY